MIEKVKNNINRGSCVDVEISEVTKETDISQVTEDMGGSNVQENDKTINCPDLNEEGNVGNRT